MISEQEQHLHEAEHEEEPEYDYDSYLEHEDFQQFIRDAAVQFITEAPIEDIAEFVFGDLDTAIESFEEESGGEEE